MKLEQVILLGFYSFFCVNIYSQKDSVEIAFEGIEISLTKVRDFSKGYSTASISEDLVVRNIRSLTDVLRFNSFIYFKEEGLGMVSSPSFRGTNANQTAVLWNGININSQLLGQSDFNTISSNSFDDIVVRNGGGSVLFGSGAIGGTVHLENNIDFIENSSHRLIVNYGSFDTRHSSYQYKSSSKKYHLNIGLGYNFSQNNYNYLRSNLSNENGSFVNYNADLNLGYRINEHHNIKLYSTFFTSDRNLSRTLNAPSNDAYENISVRALAEWNYLISANEFLSTKLAYVYDEFQFFDNNEEDIPFSTGNTKRSIAKLDYNKFFSRKLQFNGIIENETTIAEGGSFSQKNRNIFTAIAAVNHQLTDQLSYGLQLRKDFLQDYNSPFLYSLGVDYQVNEYYKLSVNTSKNFRIPTFNELYWEPGGNPNIIPEDSFQFEIGNTFSFQKTKLQINGFYIKTSNLIQWLPNNFGVWSPINVNEAENYGMELSVNHHFKLGLHELQINANYAYTIARDLNTNAQLFYVPEHRLNLLVDYKIENISIFYQQLFNDDVTFLTDTIPLFTVANIGLDYQINKSKLKPVIGMRINNVYNSYYQNTLNRPMPGINFQLSTNINF